ncbi:MAG: hypothetical protein FWE41_02405 [Coriobacteriia bacterium]|nr:hypothetical protein [Coriobacteriia bacterium]
MSDYYVRLIPEEPSYVLGEQLINTIKSLTWYRDNTTITVNESIQFADAGENFERVLCPFCKTDLIDWWKDAMDEAYSMVAGFTCLDTITPCCQKDTSLHNLDYHFPQGFFTSLIEMESYCYKGVFQVPQELDINEICQELYEITSSKWRIIRAYY